MNLGQLNVCAFIKMIKYIKKSLQEYHLSNNRVVCWEY